MRRVFDQGPPGLEIRVRSPISCFDSIQPRIPRITNRSLQDLNIAGTVNSNPQGLKGTDISTETFPSKKIKNSVIEVVPQTVFLSKTKFLLKELQYFIDSSSTKSVIRVFGGKGDSTSNISLSFLK